MNWCNRNIIVILKKFFSLVDNLNIFSSTKTFGCIILATVLLEKFSIESNINLK